MKHPHTPTRLPLLAALALAAALGACSRQQPDDELSAGQRVDNATTAAKREGRELMADARMSAREAADATARVSSDLNITAKVNAALAVDDKLKATQINVDTRDGQVTLSGQAPDAQSRERATTLASAVDGVKQVNNQLVVTRNG
ncbi:hyperosmotically inducible protein [Pelomonas saccharophila]|uniref:Hyperosmotically inducible protein n=1 Tax=Roseateles saccharophilus TaxID=304 RepID=A0ABU1YKM6_ROSSA|nr:BON domain-containing protein [Roseateles saccharophilus]MDR7269417.1 hyperosmotically inducible protein [Roseateles saccharophilus]